MLNKDELIKKNKIKLCLRNKKFTKYVCCLDSLEFVMVLGILNQNWKKLQPTLALELFVFTARR